jgi:alpha-1,2-mannosyltransferase
MAWAALSVIAAGMVLSLILFGWQNNLEYLRVLGFMSRHGEVYFPNQSVNGLLNRLLMNGSSVDLRVDRFPAYRTEVYLLTTLSSAAIALLGLFSRPKNRVADFSLVSLAATAASPIVWYHHYGILLPVFIWLFVRAERLSWVLIVAYVLISNDTRIMNLAADRPVVNLLAIRNVCGRAVTVVVPAVG